MHSTIWSPRKFTLDLRLSWDRTRQLLGFFGAPDNDNNPDDLLVTPFATDVGGKFTSVWNLNEGNSGTTRLRLGGSYGFQSCARLQDQNATQGSLRDRLEAVLLLWSSEVETPRLELRTVATGDFQRQVIYLSL
jgi:hypothetical protein